MEEGRDARRSDRHPGGLRPRFVHRLTAQDVGERVSVRHHIRPTGTSPGAGPEVTDIVGRLVHWDPEVLMVVDRRSQLHVIGQTAVVASRVVPPHPRREPEPMVGTPDRPLVRAAARVLLVDELGRVLLVGHAPSDDRLVWTAPGGGLRPDEDHRQAASRELHEELAIDVAIGPAIWTRRVTFSFRGLWIDQAEVWFLAFTHPFDPSTAPLRDHGAVTARWWRSDELRSTDVEVAPAALADHLDTLLREGAPSEPIDVGR